MEFLSRYQKMTYKIPESNKVINFNEGKAIVNDSQSVSYLKQHEDYGVTLTTADIPKAPNTMVTVGVDFCPVDGCNFVAKTLPGMLAHIRAKHPDVYEQMKESECDE